MENDFANILNENSDQLKQSNVYNRVSIGYSIPGHCIINTRYCIINLAHTFSVECHDYQLD
jgi:hypothetical protein